MSTLKEKFGTKRYVGKYRAICMDNNDPKKLGRIKMSVPEVFGTAEITDWAVPVIPILGPIKPEDEQASPQSISNVGFFSVANINARVWAEFEAGDPNRPIWVGFWYAEPDGNSEVPILAKADLDQSGNAIGDNTTQAPKGTDTATTATGATIAEPGSPYNARYPENRVLRTKSGIVIEYDDTIKTDSNGNPVSCERIHMFHPSGTYDEFHPDGSRVRRVQNNRYLIVEFNDDVHIKGTWNVVVDGDATLHVTGDYTVLVEGNKFETIKGNYIQIVEGDKFVTVKGDYTQTIESDKFVILKQNLTETVDLTVLRTVLLTETDLINGAWLRTSLVSIKDSAPAIRHN